MNCFLKASRKKAIPVSIVPVNHYSTWLMQQNEFTKNWLKTTQFRQEAGCISLLPDAPENLLV
jgi:hypothetical protein